MKEYIILCENGSFTMSAEDSSDADSRAAKVRDNLKLQELGAVLEVVPMSLSCETHSTVQ